nr:DUF3667 domain-containing protein [Chitinophagaceae bacterium]
MSHAKERTEKNCLNCGAQVQGRYCHICGQENIETHETLWGLFTHFVYDITHFDGKFFSTLRYLLFRPGFLSMEYLRGRRASYLHPIKMYVFTSALFFFILFAVRNEEDVIKGVDWDIQEKRAALLQRMATTTDTTVRLKMQDSLRSMDTTLVIMEASKLIDKHPSMPDSVRSGIMEAIQKDQKNSINISFLGNDMPPSETAYDSLQARLPAAQRDGWLRQYIVRKTYQLNAKFRYDQGQIIRKVLSKFIHSLPQMMFIS